MADGISYAGDLVAVPGGPNPQEKVQFLCSDPNFLEKAVAKKPNAIWAFVKGAYSHPRDWWVGIFWCAMRTGVFGAEAQSSATSWGNDARGLLNFAKNNPTLAARLVGVYLKHKSTDPAFYGRLAGGAFTNYASTGGRFGSKVISGPIKWGSIGSNLILASTGAVILAVKYGSRDIISIMDSIITGDYAPDLSNAEYKALFLDASKLQLPISKAEEVAIVELVDAVLDCLNNPGKYLGSAEKGHTQTVPVGTVSSSRLPGQFGSIPIGSETNMLDTTAYRRNR